MLEYHQQNLPGIVHYFMYYILHILLNNFYCVEIHFRLMHKLSVLFMYLLVEAPCSIAGFMKTVPSVYTNNKHKK